MAANLKVAVVGAGLMGRLVALRLVQNGAKVSIYDQGDRLAHDSCSWTGAGMLSPYCELEHSESQIAQIGLRSMVLWPELLASLPLPVSYWQEGTLAVAHASDQPELEQLKQRVTQFTVQEKLSADADIMRLVAPGDIEPELEDRFGEGLFFPKEGHVDNRELLRGLEAALAGCDWHMGNKVTELKALRGDHDWVVDCRGLGGGDPELRGVRGELIYLHAPEVNLSRPVRLMHPRYPIYIAPRNDSVFVVGATQIESSDRGPIRVKSALELLSAAYSLHPGFAEAEWIESSVNCRPAYPDNLPRICIDDNQIMRINGLYRHGFLMGPALAEAACALLNREHPRPELEPIIHIT